ncbi:MAG: hypothetical protein ACRD0N_11050 [Acidimicrobiales bacterium]
MSLDDVQWRGEEPCFRVLDTYFTLRYDDPLLGRYVEAVLARFRVPPDPREYRSPPTPNVPPRYSLRTVEADGHGGGEASYQLYYGDTLMIDTPTTGRTLTHLFWHVNAEAVRQTGSFLLVHAGCVLAPSGRALLLPAQSGSGKTTLVTALVQAGFGYLSDEAAVVDPVSGRIHPFPKALTLKSGSFELFPELAGDHLGSLVPGTWHVDPGRLGPADVPTGAFPAGWVVAIGYDPTVDGAQLSPMRAAEAVVEVGMSTLNLHRYRARALPLLADLARRTSAYRLRFASLEAALEAITTLTANDGHEAVTAPAMSPDVRFSANL